MSTTLQVRVGTDVESIDEVADALGTYGDRYARRLFTAHEIEACGGLAPAAAPGLTARFAAKEAVIKLLTPADVVPTWHSIEVRSAANRAPSVRLSGEAAALAERQGVGTMSLSMSHGAGIGTATVVALVTTDQG